MATKQKKPEVIEIDGKSYSLDFSMNSLCELEEATGEGALGYVSEMSDWEDHPEKVRFNKMRVLFWASLLNNHDMDLKQAGKLMTGVDLGELMPKVFTAFNNAFPQNEDAAEGN